MFSYDSRTTNHNPSILEIHEQLSTPYFLSPTEVGHFSVDHRRNIHYDRSQLKYYAPRSNAGLALNLSANYWNTVQKNFDISEKMEQLLHWIMNDNFNAIDPSKGVSDFITTRGTLKQILSSPHHFFPNYLWSICASRLKDTIYFAVVETDENVREQTYLSQRDKMMTSWGFKFEQYMTSDSPYGTPDMNSTIYQLENFFIVLRSKLENYSLLYAAEVDGLKSGTSAGIPSNYIELKTSRNSPPYHLDQTFLKHKSLKWWAQIFPTGIREIVCGFRDNDGIVRSIETFSESALTNYGKSYWNPDTCLSFCLSFLNMLKDKVVENNHRLVHKFDFIGGSSFSHQRLINPERRLKVVSDWYASALNDRFR